MPEGWSEEAAAKHDVLREKFPSTEFGLVNVGRRIDFTYENAGEYAWQSRIIDVKDGGWVLTMAHQCDEFEIGTPDDAERLIANLRSAILYCHGLDAQYREESSSLGHGTTT